MYIDNGIEPDLFGDTGIPFRPVIGLLGQALLGSEASVNGTTAYTGIRHCGLVSPSHPRLYHPRHGPDPRQRGSLRSFQQVGDDKHVLGFRFPCVSLELYLYSTW